MPAYSSAVPHWRAAEAAMVARAGDSGPVMSWWRPLAGAAASGARHRDVSAADQRYPAGSRSWPLVRERASNPRKNSL